MKEKPTAISKEKKVPLYERIRQILESARTNMARTVNTTQVVANWLIGREIVEEEQKGQRRADYGEQILEDLSIRFDEFTLLKAAVKYGKAISHVTGMYRYLERTAGSCPFEFEVSVDETDQPTTHAEHVYIASELKRMGVKWVSLAPRYLGSFEKGVDYIGDLASFEIDFAGHAAIARHFGPYKLSLHSGSDKFSIYPIAMQQTRGLIHLKTAGTSYLEALRTIARLDPEFFREIYIFARERYEDDRASYHVSAEVERAPQPSAVGDWPDLLDQFDAREILHVTFGSVLTALTSTCEPRFYSRFMEI